MSDLNRKIQDAFQINNIAISDLQTKQLALFTDLLLFWSKKINLTSHTTIDEIIEKDLVDSAYVSMYIIQYMSKLGSCLDMGAGAGFVGTVIAILNPETQIGFLESNRKKINFIREVFRKLKLSGIFINERAESFPQGWKEKFHISVSRATWQLYDYIKYANYYVQNNGLIISMLGPNQIIDTSLMQENQWKEGSCKINYTIRPKNYERNILLIKNNFPQVPRETV